jgi:hypothetical protein
VNAGMGRQVAGGEDERGHSRIGIIRPIFWLFPSQPNAVPQVAEMMDETSSSFANPAVVRVGPTPHGIEARVELLAGRRTHRRPGKRVREKGIRILTGLFSSADKQLNEKSLGITGEGSNAGTSLSQTPIRD